MLDHPRIPHVDRSYVHSEGWRRRLNGAELAGSSGYGTIPKDGGSRHPRRNLFEKLKVFRAHAVFQHGKACSVASRPGHAVDKPCTDRIRSEERRVGKECKARVVTF